MSATATKARKLSDAHEKAKGRVETLASQAAALAESFDDPGDAGKVIAARRAVEDARQERDLLAVALGAAEKAHSEAVAQEAARELEARHTRLRGEAVAIGEDIVKALVAVGRLATKNHEIVDGLPGPDYYRFFLGSYCEAASRLLCKDADKARQGGTSQIDLRLLIP
jgi:hypothetical protein